MGWFEDAHKWPELLTSSQGRDQLVRDIKHGDGVASMGSPLHGLTAGYSAHRLMSPTYHIRERIGRLRDGESFLSKEHLEGTKSDFRHYGQDAFKENWPVLAAYVGGANYGSGGLLDVSALGSSAGGTEAGTAAGALNAGAGLLGGQQQQPASAPAVYMQPQQNDGAARQKMIQEMELQALRQKPNKTMEEWGRMQQLIESQRLLG